MQLQVSHNLTIWTSQKSEFRSSKSEAFFISQFGLFITILIIFFLQFRVCLAILSLYLAVENIL